MVILSLLLGVLPSLFWLAFFLTEDAARPEPRRTIRSLFFAGFGAAVLAAGAEFYFLQRYLITLQAEHPFYVLLIFAFIEELVKFLVTYFLVRRLKEFNEKIDAIIYMITVALGFAALENILIFLGAETSNQFVELITLRSVGATLLHALASGILGFYWAEKRLIQGLAAATILHWGFNVLTLTFQTKEIYALPLLLLAALFLFYDFEVVKAEENKNF
jgi:RsiW-degrading membrane proteinase PrsW (M82 family)